jgi:hypothetical protein
VDGANHEDLQRRAGVAVAEAENRAALDRTADHAALRRAGAGGEEAEQAAGREQPERSRADQV